MTMYFLSAAIFFIVFSTIGNAWHNWRTSTDDMFELSDDEIIGYRCVLIVGSFLWFIAIPLAIVILIVYLLNKCTNKLAQYIIRLINKRNSQSK